MGQSATRDISFGFEGAYRTVRAWRSTGVPETTAAGRVSPGSLPSMTLIGTGEKELFEHEYTGTKQFFFLDMAHEVL